MPLAVAEGNKAHRRRLRAAVCRVISTSLTALRHWVTRRLARLRQRRAERQARAWLLHLISGRATTGDAIAFRHWCDEAAGHRAAFAHTRRQWMQLRTIAHAGHRPPEPRRCAVTPDDATSHVAVER